MLLDRMRPGEAAPFATARHTFRALQGFGLDLLANALAILLPLERVHEIAWAHRRAIGYALSGLHIALLPALAVLLGAGHLRSPSILSSNRQGLHEQIFAWAMVLGFVAGFMTPGLLVLHIAHRMPVALFMAVIFAPPIFVVLVLPAIAIVLERRKVRVKVPDPFASLAGTAAFVGVLWAYEALSEAVLFFARERGGVLGSEGFILYGVATYACVRLFLFYAASAYRAELVSVGLTTLHLGVRLLAHGPGG
jgi:hypothetical protein